MTKIHDTSSSSHCFRSLGVFGMIKAYVSKNQFGGFGDEHLDLCFRLYDTTAEIC